MLDWRDGLGIFGINADVTLSLFNQQEYFYGGHVGVARVTSGLELTVLAETRLPHTHEPGLRPPPRDRRAIGDAALCRSQAWRPPPTRPWAHRLRRGVVRITMRFQLGADR